MLPYGWLSLPVRSQVIQRIASIVMYSSYLCNPISATSIACAETGILMRTPVAQSPALKVFMWSRVTSLSIFWKSEVLPFYVSYSPLRKRRWTEYKDTLWLGLTSFLSTTSSAHCLFVLVTDFFLLGCVHCEDVRKPPLCAPVRHNYAFVTIIEGQHLKDDWQREGAPVFIMIPSALAQAHSNTMSPMWTETFFFFFNRVPISATCSHTSWLSAVFQSSQPPPTFLWLCCQWDQATVRCMSAEKTGWLIQSNLLFLRQSCVISGTAKAVWCIASIPGLTSSSSFLQNSKLIFGPSTVRTRIGQLRGGWDEPRKFIRLHRGLILCSCQLFTFRKVAIPVETSQVSYVIITLAGFDRSIY